MNIIKYSLIQMVKKRNATSSNSLSYTLVNELASQYSYSPQK